MRVGAVAAVVEIVTACMEGVWPALRVPLRVDIGTGDSWAMAHT